MADIPGIIEGASQGKGLGLRFLRHIERNSILLFMVPADSEDIKAEYQTLLTELSIYNPSLLDKSRILAISKTDMVTEEERLELKSKLPDNIPSIFISAITQEGIEQLKDRIWNLINEPLSV
jgi:GTP-binding protein